MKNLSTRLKNLEDIVSRGNSFVSVMLDIRMKPATLNVNGNTIEILNKLTNEDAYNMDQKIINDLLVKKGFAKINQINMFLIIKNYNGLNRLGQ